MGSIKLEDYLIFIIYEVTTNPNMPIFDIYRRIWQTCECDYRKFEYYFWQFKAGNYDLKYRGCNDHISITDLPDSLLGKIVDFLDFKTRMTLRNVSHKFKKLLGNCVADFSTIELEFGGVELRIRINQFHTSFRQNCHVDPIKRMSEQFLYLVNNPRSILGNLKISGAKFEIFTFLDTLDTLSHCIHVKNLEISVNNEREIIRILTYLEPGSLEKLEIKFNPSGYSNFLKLHRIANMNQWKMLKIARIEGFNLSGLEVEHICNLEEFQGSVEKINMEGMLELKEKLFHNINLRVCKFQSSTPIDFQEAFTHFGAFNHFGPFKRPSCRKRLFQQHRIPGSDKILKIGICSKNLQFLITEKWEF